MSKVVKGGLYSLGLAREGFKHVDVLLYGFIDSLMWSYILFCFLFFIYIYMYIYFFVVIFTELNI